MKTPKVMQHLGGSMSLRDKIQEDGKSLATVQQPRAIHNDGESIWQLVIRDMEAREAFGKTKYNTVLQISDGRDHLIDAYQEALDLAVYLRQEIEQRKADATSPDSVSKKDEPLDVK